MDWLQCKLFAILFSSETISHHIAFKKFSNHEHLNALHSFFADVQTIHRIIWSGEWEEKKKNPLVFCLHNVQFFEPCNLMHQIQTKVFQMVVFVVVSLHKCCLWVLMNSSHLYIAHTTLLFHIYFRFCIINIFRTAKQNYFRYENNSLILRLISVRMRNVFLFRLWLLFFLFPKFFVALQRTDYWTILGLFINWYFCGLFIWLGIRCQTLYNIVVLLLLRTPLHALSHNTRVSRSLTPICIEFQ